MTTDERIEIPLNKQRLILLLVSGLAFLAIGIWFVSTPESFKNGLLGNPTIVMGIGLLSIGVFGLSTFVVVRKIIDKQPGLIIDRTGITDNSSGISAGHVSWQDIKEVSTTKLFNKNFVTIVLSRSVNQNAVQQGKTEQSQTISISNNTLQCSFEELENTLKQAFEKHKVSAGK